MSSCLCHAAALDLRAVAAVADFFERRSERSTALWLIPGKRQTPYAQGVANDLRYEPVTVFHSKNVPEVSLFEIAKIIQRTCKCSVEALIIGFVLMARYEWTSAQPVTAHTMHRLYVACVQVGLKLHSDFFHSNKFMATAMGIQMWEMNRLEEGLLQAIDWYACVSAAAFTAAVHTPALLFKPVLHMPRDSISPTLMDDAALEDETMDFVAALFDGSVSSDASENPAANSDSSSSRSSSSAALTPQAESRGSPEGGRGDGAVVPVAVH
jgi:hypothetical protein